MVEKAAPERILAFDGLRGLAAIAVVCLHTTLGWMPGHGFLAVDMFFLLSGFVIAGAYEGRLVGGAGALWFIRVRMARLYPLYAFGMLLGAISLLSTPVTLARGAAFNLLFLPDLFPADKSLFPLDGPAWSLSAEVAVNLLYAWGGYRLRNGALAALVAVAGTAVAAIAIAAGTVDLGWHQTWIDLAAAVARVMFGFPLGVLIYRLHRSARLPILTSAPILPLALTAMVFFSSVRGVPLFNAGLILAGIPALFLLLLGARAHEGRLASACHWLGRLSYPIYVVHAPLICLFYHATPPVTVGTLLAQIPKLAPIILVTALVASRWVEPTARRWVARVPGRSPAGRAA